MSKPGPKIDPDVAATILVDAALLGDEAAAKRHDVSTKTVSRYRALAATDANLSDLVARKKQAAEVRWAEDLAAAIKSQIAFLTRAANAADASDPDAIHSVAGALKILADVALTSRMLDARFAERDRAARAAAGPAVLADEPEDAESDGTVH